MMKKIILLISLFSLIKLAIAEDTLSIMQYNLLYYGKYIYDCTSTNNHPDDKNDYLKTIIQHVQPDIFSVCEMDGEREYPVSDDAGYLLDNALNTDGRNYYRKTPFPEAFLANTVFYNANKLELYQHQPLTFNLGGNYKVFNTYRFFYKSAELSTTNDTVFFTCIVAHLKAGSYDENVTQRTQEAEVIMDYVKTLPADEPVLLMGDFNLYSPTEGAYQRFVNSYNSSILFEDPAGQEGEWSRNYDYRFMHTQSTRVNSGCHSGGGMDDRFDFIMTSENLLSTGNIIHYLDNSYATIGQDGSTYNGSLNTTTNTAVPQNVAQALYEMSDHLPVYLELLVNQEQANITSFENITVNPEEPTSEKTVTITAELIDTENQVKEVYLLYGNETESYTVQAEMELSDGLYQVELPAQTDSTTIYFILEGRNAAGDVVVSSSELSYEVLDEVTAIVERSTPPIRVMNPARNQLKVFMQPSFQTITIELFDLLGNKKLSQAHIASTGSILIPLHNISGGMYVIRIKQNEKILHSQKIIIQ